MHGRIAHEVLEKDGEEKDAAEQPDRPEDGQEDAQQVVSDEQKPQVEQRMLHRQLRGDEHDQADGGDRFADVDVIGVPALDLSVG